MQGTFEGGTQGGHGGALGRHHILPVHLKPPGSCTENGRLRTNVSCSEHSARACSGAALVSPIADAAAGSMDVQTPSAAPKLLANSKPQTAATLQKVARLFQ